MASVLHPPDAKQLGGFSYQSSVTVARLPVKEKVAGPNPAFGALWSGGVTVIALGC